LIYLIEKIHWNNSHPDSYGAFGYSALGYLESEEEAKKFCDNGRTFTKEDCWAFFTAKPEFRFRKIGIIGNGADNGNYII